MPEYASCLALSIHTPRGQNGRVVWFCTFQPKQAVCPNLPVITVRPAKSSTCTKCKKKVVELQGIDPNASESGVGTLNHLAKATILLGFPSKGRTRGGERHRKKQSHF